LIPEPATLQQHISEPKSPTELETFRALQNGMMECALLLKSRPEHQNIKQRDYEITSKNVQVYSTLPYGGS
jgi:hypothetical protein